MSVIVILSSIRAGFPVVMLPIFVQLLQRHLLLNFAVKHPVNAKNWCA
jgi:hypothetical protein